MEATVVAISKKVICHREWILEWNQIQENKIEAAMSFIAYLQMTCSIIFAVPYSYRSQIADIAQCGMGPPRCIHTSRWESLGFILEAGHYTDLWSIGVSNNYVSLQILKAEMKVAILGKIVNIS